MTRQRETTLLPISAPRPPASFTWATRRWWTAWCGVTSSDVGSGGGRSQGRDHRLGSRGRRP